MELEGEHFFPEGDRVLAAALHEVHEDQLLGGEALPHLLDGLAGDLLVYVFFAAHVIRFNYSFSSA